MELVLILTELRPLNLIVNLGIFCIVGYGVCVIKSSYSFQLMFLKLGKHIVDDVTMCMSGFDGARINFDRITTF